MYQTHVCTYANQNTCKVTNCNLGYKWNFYKIIAVLVVTFVTHLCSLKETSFVDLIVLLLYVAHR